MKFRGNKKINFGSNYLAMKIEEWHGAQTGANFETAPKELPKELPK
jgi:hypothetical protein